jgi:preprotein translocase subunit SecG
MYTFLMILHVVIVIALIGVILVQRGRSGGLVEALGGVESILGTKTHAVMVKITVGLAIAFFATSISLAYISKQKGKSVMERVNDQSIAPAAPVAGTDAANAPLAGDMPTDVQP